MKNQSLTQSYFYYIYITLVVKLREQNKSIIMSLKKYHIVLNHLVQTRSLYFVGVNFINLMTTSSSQPADNHGPHMPSV